uniref:Reverse transcriptase domain-containing protein n=1 Tax=Megaselia scalaris TaxID=36166 RepID=T1GK97_MEGSC
MKCPGSDGILAEMLKSGGDIPAEHIHEIITDIWRTDILPADWNESIVFPIFKKGDSKECKNYWGISILNTAYKILSRTLCERLKPYITTINGPYQCDFMPGKEMTKFPQLK